MLWLLTKETHPVNWLEVLQIVDVSAEGKLSPTYQQLFHVIFTYFFPLLFSLRIQYTFTERTVHFSDVLISFADVIKHFLVGLHQASSLLRTFRWSPLIGLLIESLQCIFRCMVDTLDIESLSLRFILRFSLRRILLHQPGSDSIAANHLYGLMFKRLPTATKRFILYNSYQIVP